MAIYTLPNILTFFRILIIPVIVYSLNTSSFWGDWVAFSLYTTACLTDFFDGYVARALRQTSMVGRFLDPIADKLLVSALLITYVGLVRLIGWNLVPALLIVCREILVSGLREFLADYHIRMPVTHLSKVKTTAQMLSLGFLMVYPSTPQSWMCYEIGLFLLWVSTLLTLWTGGSYMISALQQTHKAH